MSYIALEIAWWSLMLVGGFISTGIGLCLVASMYEESRAYDRTTRHRHGADTLRDRVRHIRDVSTGADPVTVRSVRSVRSVRTVQP